MTKRSPRIYTRTGDDGTTALLYGGRVPKDDLVIDLVGTVDEAQAALGLARAETERESALDQLLIALERDLWILMAEIATAPTHHKPLVPGVGAVDSAMVERLEQEIDARIVVLDLEAGFAVPGSSRLAANLDLARTIVRRAERLAVARGAKDSLVVTYLNRLSDLCWVLARGDDEERRIQRRIPATSRGKKASAGSRQRTSGEDGAT